MPKVGCYIDGFNLYHALSDLGCSRYKWFGYGVDFVETYHHAAYFVDRILRGAKPGDLPVEQPPRFELVVNVKTAKALGVTIPPSLISRADTVIE
jgi:putative ABC transport system substrate-binding protein